MLPWHMAWADAVTYVHCFKIFARYKHQLFAHRRPTKFSTSCMALWSSWDDSSYRPWGGFASQFVCIVLLHSTVRSMGTGTSSVLFTVVPSLPGTDLVHVSGLINAAEMNYCSPPSITAPMSRGWSVCIWSVGRVISSKKINSNSSPGTCECDLIWK